MGMVISVLGSILGVTKVIEIGGTVNRKYFTTCFTAFSSPTNGFLLLFSLSLFGPLLFNSLTLFRMFFYLFSIPSFLFTSLVPECGKSLSP